MPAEYTEFDKALRDAVTLQFNAGPKIAFQFPPKITSDGRKGDWKEDNLPGSEPVAVYEKSGPREIALTWTYIVDGGDWTTLKIAEQVRNMRGYFARSKDQSQASFRNLIVYFEMWQHAPKADGKQMSCRIKSVDVKHSDTIVTHCQSGNKRIGDAYPLRTDITVELRLWTKGGPLQTQNVDGLREIDDVKWY